jgi:hypothetical protein
MKKRSPKPPIGKVFWPSNIRVPSGSDSYDLFIKQIVARCLDGLLKSPTASEKKRYRMASKWLVYGLLQSYFSIPSVPLAMPMSSDDYSKSSPYKIRFGYRVIQRVLQSTLDLGFCAIQLGKYNPKGKGIITRLKPAGALLDQFESTGIKWEYVQPPPKNQSVFLRIKKGPQGIRNVDRVTSPEIARMQDVIFELNTFLSRQCISIDLPNAALRSTSSEKKKREDAYKHDEFEFEYEGRGSSLNMQQVFLRRMFCRGSFEQGGRFYGGWWQLIRSNLRRRIRINGFRTVERDYSGLIVALLYAREGLSMDDDPYDFGSITNTKKKRSLVKTFVIASLNDETDTFRLNKEDLRLLELTHSQLVKLVMLKHASIKHYFGSGIGLKMQYRDSQLAESVMVRMKAYGEVCLPIHDSFIVREVAAKLLQKVMLEQYQIMFGQSIAVKLEQDFTGICLYRPRQILLNSISTFADLLRSYCQHIDSYSVVLGYISSWEAATFTEDQLDAQLRKLNENRALAKDAGLPFLDEYQFNGIPSYMRHLGMPPTSPLPETDHLPASSYLVDYIE